MPRMKKADVEFHALGYGSQMVPAVNVKVYGDPRNLTLPLEMGSFAERLEDGTMGPFVPVYTDEGFTHDWIDKLSEDTRNGVWELACQGGWELLGDRAQEIWGPKVKVWAEGRSGGWAWVEGIPDFEDWDAIELSRWARFCREAKDIVDDIPYQYVTSIYINEWEAEQQEAVQNVIFG